ncbi:hypothetical protein E2562_036250, partial [Oryza meyeriana var. granulata]
SEGLCGDGEWCVLGHGCGPCGRLNSAFANQWKVSMHQVATAPVLFSLDPFVLCKPIRCISTGRFQ